LEGSKPQNICDSRGRASWAI